MFAYIQGKITYKNPAFIYIETAGVGYRLNISLQTYAKLEKLEEARVLTYLQVKEDSHTLFGFADENERQLFILLLSVSGVGASTTQLLLSAMTSDEIRNAIIREDEMAFRKVKGIGQKTAKQIILDLKSKVLKDSGDGIPLAMGTNSSLREEAMSALQALGFSRVPVQKALQSIFQEKPDIQSVEELIKMALRHLAG